jgi:protoheme IX farnesyltransferase
MVIFFWTPPHFWALAIKYKDDYAAAGIPMLPVVAPIRKVAQQMWFHTIAMIVTSFLTLTSAGLAPWTYVITAILGIAFAFQLRDPNKNSNAIFHGSITYLSVYSIILVIGVFI